MSEPTEKTRRAGWLGLLAVLAVASALRPSVVVVGPVLPDLERALGLGATGASVLTTLPVLCFGAGAFLGPVLARRFGLDVGLFACVALVLVAGILRVTAGAGVLLTGTVGVCLGLAVANVLQPALVRRDFERRAGRVTGLYTSILALFSALAAVTAVPLLELGHGRWPTPLLVWTLAAAIPVVALVPLVRRRQRSATPLARASLAMLRNRTARNLTLFMGLQSISFYVLASWLPTIFQDAGLSPARAGALLSVATLVGIPMAIIVPILAGRPAWQPVIAVAATGLVAIGWVGLALAPDAAPLLWTLLLGIGTGGTFPLTLMLIALRAPSPAETPALSATAQGGGYLLAAGGPFLTGVLHEASGGWLVPIALLLVLDVAQAFTGWIAARPAH